jgi:hypothetical protein
MEDYQTDPEVAAAILNGLQNWRAGTTDGMTYSWQVQNAVSQQEDLGWQPFLEGWLCLEWAALQQAYLDLLGSRRIGKRWVTELIKKLWQIAWDLWEPRKGSLHENINRVLTTIEQTLKSKVRENFYRASRLLHHTPDLYLLATPLSQVLLWSTEYQAAWVTQVTQAISHHTECLTSRRRDRNQMRDTLHRWLSRARKKNNSL